MNEQAEKIASIFETRNAMEKKPIPDSDIVGFYGTCKVIQEPFNVLEAPVVNNLYTSMYNRFDNSPYRGIHEHVVPVRINLADIKVVVDPETGVWTEIKELENISGSRINVKAITTRKNIANI